MKLLFYDLETTGIKYWRNGIHQISVGIEIDPSMLHDASYDIQLTKLIYEKITGNT